MVDRPSTDRPDVGLPTTAPGSRLRRLTIRARLTLTYAGLVTGSGAVLIALVYLYMRQLQVAVPEQAPSTDGVEEEVYLRITLMSEFLNTMLVISLGALVLLALLSGAVGWVVAGRMLAPLSTMNEAAKQAASGDLSRRLSLTAPRRDPRPGGHLRSHARLPGDLPGGPTAASRRTPPTSCARRWRRPRR